MFQHVNYLYNQYLKFITYIKNNKSLCSELFRIRELIEIHRLKHRLTNEITLNFEKKVPVYEKALKPFLVLLNDLDKVTR